MTNLFNNAKFAEEYKTTNNKRAIFLRFSENSEGQYAFFYVEDWGIVQVFVDSGKEVHGDIAHSVLPFKREQPQELDEAAEEYAENDAYGEPDRVFTAAMMGFKAGAKWMAEQGISFEGEVNDDEFVDSEHGILHCKDISFSNGDKVILQIRKKCESD